MTTSISKHDTISSAAARQFYNNAQASLEKSDQYERQAKDRALDLLNVQPGQRVLNVGVGIGHEHARLQQQAAPGIVVGFDLATELLRLTRARADTPLCEGDARRLPFADASFDRLYSSYVLDLLPSSDLLPTLREFGRVLRPGGRLALVSLTEGVTLPSRLYIARWKLVYAVRPQVLGGCRPLRLAPLVQAAGFTPLAHEVVVQRAFPSEVVLAQRRGAETAET